MQKRFHLGKVTLSPNVDKVRIYFPERFASILVKHVTGQWGAVKEQRARDNELACMMGKGIVLSIIEIAGVPFVVATTIGKETTVSDLHEAEEAMKNM